MKVDKIYAETRKLTTEEKASAKLIFQYFLVMYADKKHHILLRDGEDTFVHFTSHFGMKFIKDNNLQFNAEGFAKANNIYLEKIIKKDKNEFILMLNPDTTLYPNTLTELVKSHNTKDLEIVGLKINEYATNELITNGGYSYFSLTGSIKRNLLSNNKKLKQ